MLKIKTVNENQALSKLFLKVDNYIVVNKTTIKGIKKNTKAY